MKVAELKIARAKLVADARKIWDKADSEKRSRTGEETTAYEAVMADVDKQGVEIASMEKLEAAEKWASESRGRQADPADTDEAKKKAALGEKRTIEWGEDYTSRRSLVLAGTHASDEYRSMINHWMATGETRAVSADVPTSGGYMIAPTQMMAGILKFVDNAVYLRTKATVTQVPTAASLGVVSLDTDPDDADWTAELATGSEDSSMAFGKRDLHPHPLAKRIKVSNKILRMVPNADTFVEGRLGYKFAVAAEKGYMTGTGVQSPLGLFTASALGISTARDVSTSNTTTSITGDGLINAKYSLKAQYQKTAEWIFHRDAVKQIRKLKDGNGQYIWLAGLGGTPDTLLDRPVNQSEYAPNTFTTGLYVGLFGDLSFYYIADALGLTLQRLVELYAATNQTGIIGRLESDGMPALEEAFARVALA